MKKVAKKISIIFFITIYILTINCNIYADNYDVNNYSNGYSDNGHGSDCGDSLVGCASYSSPITLRVGLFMLYNDIYGQYGTQTKDLKKFIHVPGTSIVEISASDDQYTYYYDKSFNAYSNQYKNGNVVYNMLSNYKISNQKLITFGGMKTGNAGGLSKIDYENALKNGKDVQEIGYTSPTAYTTYLGLEPGFEASFSAWASNRKKIESYIMSMEKKNQVPNTDQYVSFIDFFLKVCGFSDTWELSDQARYNLLQYDYYIIVEPVYTLSVGYRDGWHTIEGTANQLMSWAKTNNEDFWIAYDTEDVAYNLMCNFVDETIPKIYNTGDQARRCKSKMNFQPPGLYFPSFEQQINYLKNNYYNYAMTEQTSYGRNIYSLKKYQEEKKKTYTCNVNVSTCDNNDFIFKSQLSMDYEYENESDNKTASKDDLYNCVYPNEIGADKLKDYMYTVGVDGNELWCYDDITYDFSQLKQLENDEYATKELVDIPKGKLTVNRTCYTKSKKVSEQDLNDLFITDSYSNYQNSFKFNFNNYEYEFIRDASIKYQDPNNKYKKEEKKRGLVLDHATYTSTFYYDYVIKDSYSTDSLNINRNTLNIDNGIAGTNSIQFFRKFKDSTVVQINGKPSNGMKETVTNSISTQLKDAFGLSNKLVNNLNESTVEITKENNQIKKSKNVSETTTVKYALTTNETDSCEFNTILESPSTTGNTDKLTFRVISLNNPFPARDGTSRLPGSNWLSETENNVYNYIENNRNVKNDNKNNNAESVYEKEPLYTITLTPSTMVKIREYNKSHNYSDFDMACETGTGRMCVDNFIRNTKYIPEINGTCKTLTSKEITKTNKNIDNFIKKCKSTSTCEAQFPNLVNEFDKNNDGTVNEKDLYDSDFYTCADKTYRSGG